MQSARWLMNTNDMLGRKCAVAVTMQAMDDGVAMAGANDAKDCDDAI